MHSTSQGCFVNLRSSILLRIISTKQRGEPSTFPSLAAVRTDNPSAHPLSYTLLRISMNTYGMSNGTV
jgi:hypothetical protein